MELRGCPELPHTHCRLIGQFLFIESSGILLLHEMGSEMIFLVNADNRRLFEADLTEMHRQRKAIFVDKFGWKIPVVADMEIDVYDRDDTMYLLLKDTPEGKLLASARLLSTTEPHLMSDLFASACSDASPRGPTIWEVSRFCSAPELPPKRSRVALLWEIICGVMETALVYGIDQVIFAANRALLPLALRCGWQARTLGPTLRDDNDEVTAAAALITPEGLRCVRERHDLPVPVMRFHADGGSASHDSFASERAHMLRVELDRSIGSGQCETFRPGASIHG